MKTDMAKIINSITAVMPCESCPYPCEATCNSSRANCNRHWFSILYNMNMEPLGIVSDSLFCMFTEGKDDFHE